jgi:hypothetical protein
MRLLDQIGWDCCMVSLEWTLVELQSCPDIWQAEVLEYTILEMQVEAEMSNRAHPRQAKTESKRKAPGNHVPQPRQS